MTQAAKVFVAIFTLVTVLLTLCVVVGLLIVVTTSRQQESLDEAEVQRRLLIECLTLAPKPGMELDEADRVHECQQETEALRTAAVIRIARTNVLLHQCAREGAADLEACVAAKANAAP